MKLSPKRLTLRLALLMSLSTVAACSPAATTYQSFPSAQDLRVEPKPAPTIETVTSAQASAAYSVELETWGEGESRKVGRICAWAKALGMRDAPC